MTVENESGELEEIKEASSTGDLDTLQVLCSAWLAKQQPDPSTGVIRIEQLFFAAHQAAVKDQSSSLAYLLSLGLQIDRDLIKGAVLSRSTRALQVLLEHGWNINEAEAYCEPPFLRYALLHCASCHPPS